MRRMGTRSQSLEGLAIGNGLVSRPAHIFQQVELGGLGVLLPSHPAPVPGDLIAQKAEIVDSVGWWQADGVGEVGGGHLSLAHCQAMIDNESNYA